MRSHSAAIPPVARITARRGRHQHGVAPARESGEAGAAPIADGQPGGRERLQHTRPLVGGGQGREVAGDPAPGGGPARVHDPAAEWPPSSPRARLSVPVGVEVNAQVLQVAHAGGRLLAQHSTALGRASVAPRGQRVIAVPLGGIVRRQGRGDASLRPEAGGLSQRRAADQRHVRALGAATNAAYRPAAPAPTTATSVRRGSSRGRYGIGAYARLPSSPLLARARHRLRAS